VSDHRRVHQFLRAVVVALVVAVIILIHFVVVIFSFHMYTEQVFLALFTGDSNREIMLFIGKPKGTSRMISNVGDSDIFVCVCIKRVKTGFFQLDYGWRSFRASRICLGGGSVHFLQWVDVYVCIRTHVHLLVGYSDVNLVRDDTLG